MKKHLIPLLLIFEIVLLTAQTPRLALVIGNGSYEGDAALKNPENDATDISAVLDTLGWKVTTILNADRRTMLKGANAFRDSLSASQGATALFFFAGHGLQLNGENYLVPLESQLESEDDVRAECVPLSEIQRAMTDGEAGTGILILDACRDNPFNKKATRGLAGTRGLTVVPSQPGGETVVIFSTSPNETAQDGNGNNGVFTEAFLKFLPMENLKIEDMMKKVRQEVIAKTGGKQQPWSSFSLSADVYFSDAAQAAANNNPDVKLTAAYQIKTLEAERQNYLLDLSNRKIRKTVSFGLTLGSFTVCALGIGLSAYSYFYSDSLKDRYDAAATKNAAVALRSEMEKLNTLFKTGIGLGSGGATLGVTFLLLTPKTKPVETRIQNIDQRIEALKDEL